MNEKIKQALENLKLINADIEDGMDKNLINIDLGLELNRLTKPIENVINEVKNNANKMFEFHDCCNTIIDLSLIYSISKSWRDGTSYHERIVIDLTNGKGFSLGYEYEDDRDSDFDKVKEILLNAKKED